MIFVALNMTFTGHHPAHLKIYPVEKQYNHCLPRTNVDKNMEHICSQLHSTNIVIIVYPIRHEVTIMRNVLNLVCKILSIWRFSII